MAYPKNWLSSCKLDHRSGDNFVALLLRQDLGMHISSKPNRKAECDCRLRHNNICSITSSSILCGVVQGMFHDSELNSNGAVTSSIDVKSIGRRLVPIWNAYTEHVYWFISSANVLCARKLKTTSETALIYMKNMYDGNYKNKRGCFFAQLTSYVYVDDHFMRWRRLDCRVLTHREPKASISTRNYSVSLAGQDDWIVLHFRLRNSLLKSHLASRVAPACCPRYQNFRHFKMPPFWTVNTQVGLYL